MTLFFLDLLRDGGRAVQYRSREVNVHNMTYTVLDVLEDGGGAVQLRVQRGVRPPRP